MGGSVSQQRLLDEFEWFHSHPELSCAEFDTTARIKAALSQAGIAVLAGNPPLKTGLVAEIQGGLPGKTVALRADIDALPVNEETAVPYRSRNAGCMHACGHDFHMAALLGAALLLAEKRPELRGSVRFVFQPSEEVPGGALSVLQTGLLDTVSEIYGFHAMPNLKSGVVAVKDGATFGSTARFAISVQGKGGHAAMPELCKDPLVAAAALVCAAQTVISRNTNPFDTAVLSFTRIESGSAWNIVPDTAFIEGTIRGLGEGNCKRAAEQLERMCGGIALAYDVSIDFKPEFDSPSTNNDKTLCDFLWKLAEGNGYEVEEFTPTLGGEDFAYYQKRIPGVFFCFGVDSPFGLHHPKFQAKTDMLFQAARLMALIAESALVRLAQG